jgi:ABC-type branched-subunit amino acid transport system substrate-binding protein
MGVPKMANRKSRLLAAAIVVATVASGLSIGLSSSGAGAAGGLKPLTVGVLTDATGLGASGNASSVQGVQAGVILARRDGYNLKYFVGDTTTSVTGGLSAGQSLVEQHHVFAVIAVSSLTFAAAPFFKAQGTPVIGVAEDASEWITDSNMFSVYGIPKTSLVNTASGAYFKSQGVTNLGSIGYAISPSSAEAAEGAAASATHAGIKAGYVNAAFPFGSTNVAPIALAMKSAGVNGLSMSTDPNTAYALIDQLKLDGVHLKAVLLATGYGGDVTSQASPAEAQAAQGVSFENPFEVQELNTPATKQFGADLKAAGIKGLPTQSEYNAYVSVGLLLQGLKAAGKNPTQASLIAALSKVRNFDALGLFGNYPVDLANRNNFSGHCLWIAKLKGKNFDLVPGAEPICGHTIPGLTVSPPT